MHLYKFSELMFTSGYFSAVDCVTNSKLAIYGSSEVTSGYRMFEAMRENKVRASAELEKNFADAYKSVRKMNADSARDFAEELKANGSPVINPVPLGIPGWGQPEYLAFWEEIIRTRVKEVYFNDKWEFSNGCTYEFAVAVDAGKPTLDVKGNRLSAEKAVGLIQVAIDDLKGFDTTKLEKHLHELQSRLLPPKRPSQTQRTLANAKSTYSPGANPAYNAVEGVGGRGAHGKIQK
jgi:hypothetical protein